MGSEMCIRDSEGYKEEEKERNAKNEIEFPDPDHRSENIKLEGWNVKPERTLTVDDKKRQAGQHDGLQNFDSSSVWFPQNGKLLIG